MNFRFILILLLLFVVFFPACEKDSPYEKPTVTIKSPEHNDAFNLPGTMLVEFEVTSPREIKYIKLTVDDADLNPLFSAKFFYPDSNTVVIAHNYLMNDLVIGSAAPFYVHIAVDDGVKLTHTYQEISLINAEKTLKGIWLITRPSVNKTNIVYYDTSFQESEFASIDGEFIDAVSSIASDKLFLATEVPGKLYCFDFESRQIIWSQEPEAPYPEYTDLYHDQNNLFVGYANERIAALDDFTGMTTVGTNILVDSVPLKVGVSDQYFLADFKKRTSSKSAFVVFYRSTGRVFQSIENDISVSDFYPSAFSGAVDVFGNFGDDGVMMRYYFQPNETGNRKIITAGNIRNTCRVDNVRYMISIGDKIYRTIIENGMVDLYLSYPGEVIDLEYDNTNEYLFVARANELQVYFFPDRKLIKSIASDAPIKAVVLRFGY